MVRINRLRSLLIIVAVCMLWYEESCADDTAQGSLANESTKSVPRHRIDLTAVFLDTLSADSANGILGYTYNLTSNSIVNFSIPYLNPDIGVAGDSGFGDTVFSFSYVPSVKVGANPWLPRTVGTGIAVLIPTGNSSKGRSLDAWVISPYLGLIIPLTDRFFFAPQIGYTHSLGKIADGSDLRFAFADLGLGFVAKNGFWFSYFPYFARDFESSEWAINHRFAVGKMLSETFGLSFDYSFIERFDFGNNVPGQTGFDESIEINVHFAF